MTVGVHICTLAYQAKNLSAMGCLQTQAIQSNYTDNYIESLSISRPVENLSRPVEDLWSTVDAVDVRLTFSSRPFWLCAASQQWLKYTTPLNSF